MEGKKLTSALLTDDEAVIVERYEAIKQVNDAQTIHKRTGIPLRAIKEVLYGRKRPDARPMTQYRTRIMIAISDLVIERHQQVAILEAKVSAIRQLAAAS